MEINKCGEVVEDCWKELPFHFESVELDKFVIMPNHFHGIIRIFDAVGNNHDVSHRNDVGHRHAYDLRNTKRQFQKIPIIVGSFKSAVSKRIHKISSELNFRWQSSYYDRIIRNGKELYNIRTYITFNPLKWDVDIENPTVSNEINAKEIEKLIDEYYEKLRNGNL